MQGVRFTCFCVRRASIVLASALLTLLVLLMCLPLAATHAADSPDAPYPTDLSEAPEKFKKEMNAWAHSQDAQHKAKVRTDRVILAARFKAHPEQLNDPELCGKLLVKKDKNSHDLFPYTQASYYMMEACNDVTGVTARMKRAQAADCASGNPNGPCAIWAQIEKKDKEKLDKDIDDFKKSLHDAYTPCAINIANCGDGGALDRINNEYERGRELNNMRQQFQSENEQRRIDDELEADDAVAMDKAYAHDALANGDYEQAKQWEEKARIDGP